VASCFFSPATGTHAKNAATIFKCLPSQSGNCRREEGGNRKRRKKVKMSGKGKGRRSKRLPETKKRIHGEEFVEILTGIFRYASFFNVFTKYYLFIKLYVINFKKRIENALIILFVKKKM